MGVRAIMAAVSVGAAGLLVGGCGGTSAQIVENRAYPIEKLAGPTLDIQVIRRETRIELTNTTARSFGPFTMWLNQRYARKVDGLAVGETVALDLGSFVDRWNDRFRSGGFFATEKSERLAKAEVEPDDGGPILGLVVVRGEE